MAWNNNTTGMVMKGRRVKNKKKGSPDIEALKNGIYLACEVKGPNTTLKEDQLAWLNNIVRHGGVACVVSSLNDAILAVNDTTSEGGNRADIWIGRNIKLRMG